MADIEAHSKVEATLDLLKVDPLEKESPMISREKNTPAMGALNPAATPAAEPANNNILRLSVASSLLKHTNLLLATPISTAGPSGPSELPVPRVNTAEMAFPIARKKLKLAPFSTSATSPPSPGPNDLLGINFLTPTTINAPNSGIRGTTIMLTAGDNPPKRVEEYSTFFTKSVPNLNRETDVPVRRPTIAARKRNLASLVMRNNWLF
mmetsp:Transcript_730/g.1059  ORF Transcript_730/g.1059 Transcript_730/m.1059 type:complete len:208 (+) Transcript_730:598-1221(+)